MDDVTERIASRTNPYYNIRKREHETVCRRVWRNYAGTGGIDYV